MPRFASWSAFFVVLFTLVCCGGSGGVPTSNPKVTINWPNYTRDITAPNYALSAIVQVTMDGSTDPIIWTVDRPPGIPGSISTYSAPKETQIGKGSLYVVFKSGPGGSGQNVASASTSIFMGTKGTLFNKDGGPLGTISYGTMITDVQVEVTNFSVGTTLPVLTYGTAPDGIVALPNGSLELSITAGSANVSLNNYTLTGLNVGPATLHVHFDTIVKDIPLSIVAAQAQYARYALPTTSFDVTQDGQVVWALFSSSSAYPNSIATIDPLSGAVGTPIPVASNGQIITISPDGHTAYVAYSGNSDDFVEPVNLLTGQVGTPLDLKKPAWLRVSSIRVNPYYTSQVEIGFVDTSNLLIDFNTSLQSPTVVSTTGTDLFWTSNSEVVGTESNGKFDRIAVTPTSAQPLQQVDYSDNEGTRLHLLSGSRMVSDHGRILSTTDLTYIDSIPQQAVSAIAANDTIHNIFWSAISESTDEKIFATELNPPRIVDTRTIPMQNETVYSMKRFQSRGLIVATDKAIYFVAAAPAL